MKQNIFNIFYALTAYLFVTMLLPENVLALISEYSKPLTRPNWREGSNCCNIFKYSDELRHLHQIFLNYITKDNYEQYIRVRCHTSFIHDVQMYGEDIFKINPHTSLLEYTNFYFTLRRHFIIKKTHQFLIRQYIDFKYEDGDVKPFSTTEMTHVSELDM